MALSREETNNLKRAPAVEGVLPVILERWSPRSFDSRPVGEELLKKVFEAARWAPSSFNEQPWRFLLGRRGDATYAKIFEALGGFNKGWTKTAPVLILGAAKTRFSHDNSPNEYARHDLGAASAYLVLQAHALGLKAHQMAGFDHDAARKLFQIPEEYALGSTIALGYQGEPEALGDEKRIAQETAPRARKALGEIVFSDWGVAGI
jgi:nitroreductase